MEILATIPVYNHPWIFNLYLAIAIVAIMAGFIFIVEFISRDPDWIPIIIGVVLGISGLIGTVHVSQAMERTSYLDYTKYKVIIGETISARELLDKYEILEREGEIFTIKEIEVEE